LNNKPHFISELIDINKELIPLKEVADRELVSIRGLTGMVYTPALDAYMQLCIKKADILACLKKRGVMPLSEVELISSALEKSHKKVRNHTIVEYNGKSYERRFSPLKLSKSGKNVQKWAKFWLLQSSDGKVDHCWESQVREIWPAYFLIRTIDL
jgi:hypothetical protein